MVLRSDCLNLFVVGVFFAQVFVGRGFFGGVYPGNSLDFHPVAKVGKAAVSQFNSCRVFSSL